MLIDEAGVMSYQFDYFQSAGLSQVSCKIIHETAQKTSIRVQRKFCMYHLSSKNMWKDLLNWRKRHFSISFIFPIRRKKKYNMLIVELNGKHMRFLMIHISRVCSELCLIRHLTAQNTPEANLTPAVKLKYLIILSAMVYNGTVSFYWNQTK